MSSTVPAASSGRRIPSSTYRLQVDASMDLARVRALVPYLRRLGVDWIYLSPLLAAEPGSTHGYDVVDPTTLDPSRGTDEDFAALAADLEAAGSGLVLDIVPNHVGVATAAANPAWWDLLQHGQDAAHAGWFDVDWGAFDGRVMVPILGEGTEEDPEAELAHLRIVDHEGEPALGYWDNVLPLAPGSLDAARAALGERADAADAGDEGAQNELARAAHDRQHYRLVPWTRGDAQLNYRRFFTITTLAGVRVEDPEVFAATHAEVARWIENGWVQGLRVDHPDGLADPGQYVERLRRLLPGGPIWIEKILEPGEDLPAAWDVEGTTGYDALGAVDRALTPARAAGTAEEDAAEKDRWNSMVLEAKRDVAAGQLAAETARLVREVRRSLPDDGALASAAEADLAAALGEVMAHLHVYRTYLPTGRARLDGALADAAAARPELAGVLDALAPLLTDPAHPAARRMQQTSGMVMAKGVEDRCFYRYTRWAHLNEVGGDPSDAGGDAEALLRAWARRCAEWPHAMTTLSTHDTKRGEDTRARIMALAEHADDWAEAFDELDRLHPLEDSDFARLLWESVLGVWPVDGTAPEPQRLVDFALKAAREAGLHTTWTAQDEDYEARVTAAMEAACAQDGRVREVLQSFADRIAATGQVLQLSQKLLQLTGPGVPDVYQGTELPAPTLVDPDNRRPVDYERRAALLERIDAGLVPAGPVLEATAEGLAWTAASGDAADAAKLAVVAAALRARRDRPHAFTRARPLDVTGAAADKAIAVDRGEAVVVVVREPLALAAAGGFGDTVVQLPSGPWREVLTDRLVAVGGDGCVRLADLLARTGQDGTVAGTGAVALLLRDETTETETETALPETAGEEAETA
ncbi:malto-oligosyltrehalose synthase [Micrococcus lylae]|nr:malto-oligosyltrehalose synthase [Micrococcus lylae]